MGDTLRRKGLQAVFTEFVKGDWSTCCVSTVQSPKAGLEKTTGLLQSSKYRVLPTRLLSYTTAFLASTHDPVVRVNCLESLKPPDKRVDAFTLSPPRLYLLQLVTF